MYFCAVSVISLLAVDAAHKNKELNYYYYSTEKDLSLIAERITNTNMGRVKHLRRHDELWMNRRVRGMNL
jgi:hypothetical protein